MMPAKKAPPSTELVYTLQLDQALHPLAVKLVDEMVAGWKQSDPKARRPRAEYRQKLDGTMSCLLANLIANADTGLSLSVNFNANWYSENRGILPDWITFDSVTQCTTHLQFEGWLTVIFAGVPGEDFKAGKGENTKIAAGPKLTEWLGSNTIWPWNLRPHPHASAIRLKDDNKKRIPIPADFQGEAEAMGDRLRQINEVLLRHWADIELPASEMASLQKGLAKDFAKWKGEEEGDGTGKDHRPIDLSRRTLYRVFNNNSIEEGGRFYGPWWQGVPSRLRHWITINGKPTEEIDYSSLHPTMLYAMEGQERPSNPYDIGLPDCERGLIKRAFNALLNVSTKRNPKEFPDFDAASVGCSWKEFLAKIREANKPIAHHFHTGVGLRLQRKDSDIAEAVMLHFAEQGIPVLPIHDSFIMHHGYDQELADVMQKAFQDIMGFACDVKPDFRWGESEEEFQKGEAYHEERRQRRIADNQYQDAQLAEAGIVIPDGLDEEDDLSWVDAYFSPQNPYYEYDSRCAAWSARRASVGVREKCPDTADQPSKSDGVSGSTDVADTR